MKDSPDLIQASRQFAQEDRTKSWRLVIVTWVLWLGSLAGTVWNVNLAGQIVCMVLAGLIGVRAFILYHDHQHGAILRGSRPGDLLMRAFGYWILTPSSIWKRSHNFHHKHNAKIYGASIGSYPVMTVSDYQKATRSTRVKYRFVRHPITIFFGYLSLFIYGFCIRSFRMSGRRHLDSLLALLLHLALVVVCALVSVELLVLTLLGPLFITHALGAYLFYAQHNFPGVELRDRREWTYEFAAVKASSYMRMSRVMHWFTGNIGYHHVHHLNARIPFYRLPEALESLPALHKAGTTSWLPWDMYRCLKLALWDHEAGRMVSYRDAGVSAR